MSTDAPSLRSVDWRRFLSAPDAQLLDQLYVPALCRAVRYDRCCAYFSSGILAVAARGFGGLITNLLRFADRLPRPAVRLLVNEQLDEDDLEALLARADEGPAIEALLRRFKTPRDALERNRLEMLAWLAREGWLEVRVGWMARTRGIVHAKYGIVRDLHGDAIAFMGSGNETAAALVENYEMLELRPAWVDPEFVDQYQAQFDALWENRNPDVRVYPLPEAVRLKIVSLAPPDPPVERTRDRQARTASLLWHYLAQAAYLPGGERACDATAPVDLWPHQRRVVEDTASAFPVGRLLCDEVGMGKTIEALAILRRLLAGRGVRRALLLVPAGLLQQWQEELREKGGLAVPRWERDYLVSPDGDRKAVDAAQALAENDVLLLSREWARLSGNRDLVLAAPPWDLVLLDEAHAARRIAQEEGEFNSGNLLLQLLRELQLRRRARGILLLSATPMQTQPWEPWDLLGVLGIGDRWMVAFEDIRAYYAGVRALRSEQVLHHERASLLARLVEGDPAFPPVPPGDAIAGELSLSDRLMMAFGDHRGRYAGWLRRGAPLGRRMHRNTRDTLRDYHRLGLLPSSPPRREVRDEVFDYRVQAERDCYEAITRYIDRRYEQLEAEKRGKGFVITVYRRRAASSPRALRCSLERRAERLDRVIRRQWSDEWLALDEEQIDARDLGDAGISEYVDPAVPSSPAAAEAENVEIASLVARLDELGATDSKLARFWEVLQQVTVDGRAALVFTEYTDTMTYLRDRLRPTYGPTLACYSGDGGQVWDDRSWVAVSKAEITERLDRGELNVLVCTDAASEGLNLQAASALINYDLPWNPSKVEQRIGRIDRIGQEQPFLPIRNLFLNDSVDMRVYQLLRERCGLFEHFVGPMQPVLALARTALRRPDQVDDFVANLGQQIAGIEQDAAVANTYVASPAEVLPEMEAPVTRADLEDALTRLQDLTGPLQASRLGERPAWRIRRLAGRHSVRVTVDREELERHAGLVPLNLCGGAIDAILSKLPLPSGAPLVLEARAHGSYRCAEARWVTIDGIEPITSARQLVALAEAWDGPPPPPDLLLQAQDEARTAAGSRLERMERAAQEAEEAGLRRQVQAARRRLLRELGRTLRCLGSGELDRVLRRQVQREALGGRYHQTLRLLGGYPTWSPEQIADADAFVGRASDRQLRARVAGSEVDAALNDPRWKAKTVLKS